MAKQRTHKKAKKMFNLLQKKLVEMDGRNGYRFRTLINGNRLVINGRATSIISFEKTPKAEINGYWVFSVAKYDIDNAQRHRAELAYIIPPEKDDKQAKKFIRAILKIEEGMKNAQKILTGRLRASSL